MPPEDPMEPIGHVANRVMHDVRKRRTPHMVPLNHVEEPEPINPVCEGDDTQSADISEQITADVERITKGQNR